MGRLVEAAKARAGLLAGLDETRKSTLLSTIFRNPYIPWVPTEKQAGTLVLVGERELLYGGAAGGGKSVMLLMAALQYVHRHKSHSLIIRRTYSQLIKPGALIPLAHAWLGDTDAKWSEAKKQWVFPNGSILEFGHMEYEKDKHNYQGTDYDFIGFDELTQFTQSQYTYMFSRLGRTPGVPPRIWSTSNPGGIGHDWVKARFLSVPDEPGPDAPCFIPARLDDNPYIAEVYAENLEYLDPITKAQLKYGDWDVRMTGGLFSARDFVLFDPITEPIPYNAVGTRCVRYWDCAATEDDAAKDPDYTVGLKMLSRDGVYWVCDVIRGRWDPSRVEEIQRRAAETDGPEVAIREEEEGGSSGKAIIQHKARHVFRGYDYRGIRSTGSKSDRAKPVASAVANHLVRLPKSAPWLSEFLDEVVAFPLTAHDDQVDALSGAYNSLELIGGDPSRFRAVRTGYYDAGDKRR